MYSLVFILIVALTATIMIVAVCAVCCIILKVLYFECWLLFSSPEAKRKCMRKIADRVQSVIRLKN